MLRKTIFGAAALGLLLTVTACEQGRLLRPASNVPVDPLFSSYVAVGNSVTAGFQSGGINEITQGQSYAVLLARQMQTPFFIPAMNQPGCPPLFTNVFTQTRASPIPCALRKTDPAPSPYINNVSVPGAEVMDAIANLDTASNANALTTFFLGGLTQIQMLRRARPSFVSVWIGNNDVLGAATNSANGGDTTRITPAATFATRFNRMMDSIDLVRPQGGVLVGVANVTTIPFFSAGATYWVVKNTTATLPPTFTVNNNCAPVATGIPGARGDSVLVPVTYGGALIAAAAAGVPTTLSCADAVPQILVPAELLRLLTAVAAYNQTIQAAATARGWAYLDPTPTLDSLRMIPTEVAPFPAFGAPCSANPFGLAFTCDAVHPSARTHKLIANKLVQAINATYGTRLAAIP